MNIEQPWSTHVISSVVTPFSATCSVCRTSVWTKNSSKSMTTSLLHTFVSWRYDLGVADVALADLVMAVIESGSLEKWWNRSVSSPARFVGRWSHGALGKPVTLVRQKLNRQYQQGVQELPLLYVVRFLLHFFQAFLPMILGSLSCHWSHLITCLQTAREPSWI